MLSAQGTHPTAGFSAFFVNSPVSPFEFALVHQAPTGPAAPTVTPFSTSIVFPAAGSPATVTVHDALGTHFVPVEQMGPSFAVASPLAHAAFAAPHLTAAAATATAQGTPLVPIEIPSIYKVHGQRVNLPARLAKCTPDTYVALGQIGSALEAAGGKLYLSDLYRSYDDQWQAHQDYVTGRKPAYSPPPGGSMHEAGRAFDLDLDALAISLAEFWEIARAHGVYPIIRTPNSSTSEAWHFDRRGSHGRVYDYYSSGQATNMKPYTAMAVSSILANGERVDRFSTNRAAAAIQCALLRLGFNPGRIDGSVGQRTRGALAEANVPLGTPDEMLARLDGLLRLEFPEEFAILPEEPGEPDAPEHLIP